MDGYLSIRDLIICIKVQVEYLQSPCPLTPGLPVHDESAK